MASGTQIAQAYIQIVPVMENMGNNIKKALGDGAKEGNSFGSKLGSGISKGLGVAVAGIGTAVAGATAVIGKLGKEALDSYADFEQLTGGVETLFGTSASTFNQYLNEIGATNADNIDEMRAKFESLTKAQDTVFENAQNAFKTSGLSANEYMETVTSFSASLIASLDGDTQKASEQAEKAIVDMSDNANKMGSSMESIQNAYQGFAKQNYTMLDNLKLGYGGTKSEMERLLKDAGEIAGVKFNIESYSDVIEAIHVMQESMGIAGTTAKEAEGTISGSINMLKASWQNLLTAFGTGDTNMISQQMTNLLESVGAVANNIVPRIQTLLPALVDGLVQLINNLIPQIAPIIKTLLPSLLEGAVQLVQGLLEALPTIVDTLKEIIPFIVDAIVDNLPMLIEVGLQIMIELSNSLSEALPTLIPTLVDVVLTIVDTLAQNSPLMLEASVKLILALATGIVNSIPLLVKRIPEIIKNMIDSFKANAPKLKESSKNMMQTLADSFIEAKDILLNKAKELVEALKNKIIDLKSKFKSAGTAIVEGIKEGLSSAWHNVTDWVSEKLSSIIAGIKEKIAGAFKTDSSEEDKKSSNEKSAPTQQEQAKTSSISSLYTPTQVVSDNVYIASENARSASVMNSSIEKELISALSSMNISTNVVLEGDAGKLFRSVIDQNKIYINSTGRSAFA